MYYLNLNWYHSEKLDSVRADVDIVGAGVFSGTGTSILGALSALLSRIEDCYAFNAQLPGNVIEALEKIRQLIKGRGY